MIDARFFEMLGPLTVRELAGGLHAEGDLDRLISAAAPFDRAGPNDLCYYEGPLPRAPLAAAPGVCLVRAEVAPLAQRAGALIVTPAPRAQFGALAQRIVRPRVFGEERIHASARLEDGVALGAGVVIGEGAQIGAGARIGPNTVIGPGVAIGRRTRIGANCTLGFSLIGDDVTILAGAVIGEAGFGVAADSTGLHDVPHLGRVIVQDRATIGANTAIDRGVFDDTIIAEEAKIDNLCQIAHNVVVGRRTMMAAFAGVSPAPRGSATMCAWAAGSGCPTTAPSATGPRLPGALRCCKTCPQARPGAAIRPSPCAPGCARSRGSSRK
jgi:UDP-3-O-[3-hydroxymyristoyl] glucosamine N-acyltransferase